jgi:hypothetical protein
MISFKSSTAGIPLSKKIRRIPITNLQAEMCISGWLEDRQGIIDPRNTKNARFRMRYTAPET